MKIIQYGGIFMILIIYIDYNLIQFIYFKNIVCFHVLSLILKHGASSQSVFSSKQFTLFGMNLLTILRGNMLIRSENQLRLGLYKIVVLKFEC